MIEIVILIMLWLMAILAIFVVISYLRPYRSPRSLNILRGAKLLFQWVGIFLALMMFLLWGASEHFPTPIHKELHVTIKDDNPCFYVDAFEGIENFKINDFTISKMDSEIDWRKKTYTYKMDDNSTISLSSITGKDQCLLYGVKNMSASFPPKKLQTNVIYAITMQGTKKNIPKSSGYIDLKDGDRIFLYRVFYLAKNPKMGKKEIVIPSQMQLETRMKN
jgi:hypothetical protein